MKQLPLFCDRKQYVNDRKICHPYIINPKFDFPAGTDSGHQFPVSDVRGLLSVYYQNLNCKYFQ